MQNQMCAGLFCLLKSEISGAELDEESKNLIKPEVLFPLYKLSKAHDLAHAVADALDKNHLLDDSDISKKFRAERNMAVMRYEQSNYALEELCDIFEKEKIENIPLKGSVLRAYYPQPWLRTSCDIDILIRQSEIKKVVALLTEKYGYEYVIHTQHDYSVYSPGGVHIELHFIVIFHDKAGVDITNSVWETAVCETGYEFRKRMEDGLFLAYHIAHMAQHVLEGGGCGIKPFIDLQIISHTMGISLEQAKEALEKCSLTVFAEKVIELSEKWFGKEGRIEKLSDFEKYVLTGGVYGTIENQASVGTVKKKGKLRYIFKRLFVPYGRLCLLYPSLKKCPILFPFYQVRRWFRLFKKDGLKVSGALEELKTVSNIDEERSKKTSEMLKELGL